MCEMREMVIRCCTFTPHKMHLTSVIPFNPPAGSWSACGRTRRCGNSSLPCPPLSLLSPPAGGGAVQSQRERRGAGVPSGAEGVP